MDAYVGQIMMWAGKKIPSGWHLCDGSLVNVNDYQVLFAVLGTTYGGDGVRNFALPDLRGRVPVGQGQGEGHNSPLLSPRVIGQGGGAEVATVTVAQMPFHTHTLTATSVAGTSNIPTNNVWANYPTTKLYSSDVCNEQLGSAGLSTSGGNSNHENMMPSFPVNFMICLVGLYPQRS